MTNCFTIELWILEQTCLKAYGQKEHVSIKAGHASPGLVEFSETEYNAIFLREMSVHKHKPAMAKILHPTR